MAQRQRLAMESWTSHTNGKIVRIEIQKITNTYGFQK